MDSVYRLGFNLTNHPAGVAYSHDVAGNILCDNASGADDHIAPDGHPGHDMHTGTNPYIVTQGDGIGILQPPVSGGIINGMTCGIEAAGGGNQRLSPKVTLGAVNILGHSEDLWSVGGNGKTFFRIQWKSF